ncbi:hypothetical protein [Pseudomonas izuensis]|uniref:hypothetical protein n=1 Tax=Pseudomonas izuensis TaxID=2684212 RepID=UPI00135B5AF2|nr:hypothetical protein [Pseudomonas izuensis]
MHGRNSARGDLKEPFSCPVYSAILTPDSPEAADGAIVDQGSLETAWVYIVSRLRTEALSEEDVLQTLKSGMLQSDTGKTLAPLFVDAILRSIKPLEGFTPERLREFVEVICHLPPNQWADAFGENVNFPRGRNGEGVHEFIQTQLEHSRLQREQRVADGELLDDGTWKELREFTQYALKFVRNSSDAPFDRHVRQLEDYLHVRPSPKDARTLATLLVKAFNDPDSNERKRWTKNFELTAQQFNARLESVEIVDNRPELSEALRATLSKIATPINTTLTKLGAMSLKDAGEELKSAVSIGLTKAGSYFVFGGESEPVAEQQTDRSPAKSPLLLALQEIENKSSFFDEVITTGPRYAGGLWGKVLYVANALDTVGVLGVAEKVRPHLPAVPTSAAVVIPPEAPEVPPLSVADLRTKAEATEKEVNDFFESLPPTSAAGKSEDAGASPIPLQDSQPTSSTMDSLDFEHIAQAFGDVLSRIDNALTFPSASANELEELLQQLEETSEGLEALAQFEPVGPLQVTPVSWWEPIAQQLKSVLLRITTALAPYTPVAASTAWQLIKDNPRASVTAVFAAAALYNDYRHTLQDPTAPGTALPPEAESPALHHERLENDIEQILGKPVAAGEPALSQTILKLMYQSTEHDLLDDEQLIEDVAQALQQPSPQDPAKTYLELIHETQAAKHAGHTFTEPVSDAHRIRKRDTAAVDASVVSLGTLSQGVEPTPDIEESESEKVAALTHYLNTMDELESVASATDEVIDDGPEESATDTARQVIRLLRHRRAAIWTDASRGDGDKQLVERYAGALTKYAEGKVSYSAATVIVPMHSTFGQCWLNFVNAFKNPFFIDWARQANLDLATVKIRTADNTLTGKVKGVETTFTLNDNSGWANVAGPLLRMAHIVDPTYIGVAYPTSSSIPLALISGFHGEPSAPGQPQARQRAQQLATDQAFTQIQPDDPLRPLQSRSEAQAEKQRQRLGDLYTHHALITALTDLINDKPDSASVNLNGGTLAAHKDSLFAIKHPQEARRMVTAQRFISAMGWNVPKTVGEIRNLIKVISFVLPESAERADYKGALGYGRPLTATHIRTIRETVQSFETLVAGGLLNTLLQHKTVTSPVQGLDLALNSDKAIQLGKSLESKLNAVTTPGSATEWVMAAMLLDLDPTPGQPRNHVVGYNLTQSANWGAKPSAVVSRLQAHLVAGGKVSATTAPVAAYHLLSAFAPEFLVRDMPDNLVCGSHTWTSFRIAVARIEQIDPGATRQMTFEQVMNYGSTDPITAGQEIAAQSASVDPLIDWAIANGVLVANATDTYTAAQLDIAREKFNGVRTEMAGARDSLTADMPTREGLALAELERVFGKGLPYEDLCLRRKNIPYGVQATMYSLLDLYITGQLEPGIWSSYNDQIPIRTLEKNFKQLKPVESLFKATFTTYFDNLRSGSESVFKYLISQLPLEDRQSLEYGNQKFYSVRSAIDKNRYLQTPEEKEAHKGRHGILIRSEYRGKITYYEVFPGSVEIRKNTKLPVDLKLNGEIKTFSGITDPKGGVEKQCATPQPIDWDAYEKGLVPRNDVTSDVIIEEIKPITQHVTFYPAGYNFDRVPDAFSPGSRVNYLAKVVVDEHFVVGRDKLESLARGSTNSENEKAFRIKVLDFFASLVPFKSCIDNISQGNVGSAVFDCVLDAAGFVIPGGVAAGQAVKVAKTAGKFVPKALRMTWIMSSSLVSSANPLDGVGDVFRFGKNVVCKLGTTAYRAAGVGIDQIKNLYGTTKAIDHAQLLKRADIAEGVVSTGTAGLTSPVTALFKDGKWYAFDAARNRPCGPPLDNFRPASSIALEPTTFSDGSIALTPSRLFDTEPHTIQRLSGDVDVVVGDNVYRFNPEQPQTLTDLTSPAYSGELEGFDAVCNVGGKSKRGVTCLSKYIGDTATHDQKRAQALEHKRLWPSKGVNARVIHERRIFHFDGIKGKANAAPSIEPLEFKSETTGSIIKDQNFGFLTKQVDTEIEKNTCTVRINAIVNGVDDMRDVRAFKVGIPGYVWGKYEYLVAEVDTGLFYYCVYNKKKTDNIQFIKIDFSDDALAADLIKGYHRLKDPFLVAGKGSPSRPFMALPTLDNLYSTLIDKKGFTTEQIEELTKKVEIFSDVAKREFLIDVWNKNDIRDIEVFIMPININIATKQPGFDKLSEHSKNSFYASAAKTQVDTQIQATGLGSFNQQLPYDSLDVQRAELTKPVVLWEYSRVGAPNYAQTILKTGAGNCDQLAYVSAEVAIRNGAHASLWNMPGAHAFTVIGIPMGTHHSTIDFSEPEYINAWVVDAWADISCPASQYMQKLKDQMAKWSAEGRKIIATDWKATPPVVRWMDPMDKAWIEKVIDGPKEVNSKKKPEINA